MSAVRCGRAWQVGLTGAVAGGWVLMRSWESKNEVFPSSEPFSAWLWDGSSYAISGIDPCTFSEGTTGTWTFQAYT